MKTLAFYHMKGGVGKTASVVNLSYLAAESGAKTLIWDLDPQASATYYFRVKAKIKSGAKSLLKSGKRLSRDIKGTDYDNLDILPADFSFRNLDIKWEKLKRPKSQIREIIRQIGSDYDFIFLDCPPNLTVVSENVFKAADYIFVPVIPTTLSVRTYEKLLTFSKKNNYDPQHIFAFLSMVESRKKMHKETMNSLLNGHRHVLQNHIPYRSAIENMGIHRQPVTSHMRNSESSQAYEALWDEIKAIIE